MVDNQHRLAVELAQAREQAPVTGVVCRLRNERDAARRERDEARRLLFRYYDEPACPDGYDEEVSNALQRWGMRGRPDA